MVLRANYRHPDGSKDMGRDAEICFKCGVCCVIGGHSCHAQFSKEFTPTHTYVYDCLGSENPSENPHIWFCVSCHKCEELCPYDVSPIEYIENLKASALEQGRAPYIITEEMRQIIESGYAFPLTRTSRRLRDEVGMEPLSPMVAEELKILARMTGLLDKLEADK